MIGTVVGLVMCPSLSLSCCITGATSLGSVLPCPTGVCTLHRVSLEGVTNTTRKCGEQGKALHKYNDYDDDDKDDDYVDEEEEAV